MTQISKELFEEVTGLRCKFGIVGKYDIYGRYCEYTMDYTVTPYQILYWTHEFPFDDSSYNQGVFNIDSFFFKCKKWAYDSGFQIITYCIGKEYDYFIVGKNDMLDGKTLNKGYHKVSEQQAVFDACKWILKEIKKCIR